ncbi:adenosine receptor A3-like [Acanthaster planci]|uniref:Adenosine receptor A3-like n=1 Tax=Acanthaster planci TaxID=133434 RepID=A0A8B7ZHS3_ACAPL|nr:adenosine receptor A3-like [Acanthaster planci]
MDNFTKDDNFSFAYACPNDVVCLLEVTVVIAVSFLVVTSNITSLVVLVSTPSFRNGHGYLLMSLSVADLLVGGVAVLSIYPSADFQDTAYTWPYGDTVCLIAAYAGQLALINSGLALLALSIERYIAVAHPLKYASLVTKKTVSIVITVCWIVSASVFITILLGILPHSYAPQFYICQSVYAMTSLLSLVPTFAAVLPCFIIMLVTSAIVGRKLKESARRRAAMAPAIPESSNSSGGTAQNSIKLYRTVRIMMIAICFHLCPFLIVRFLTIFHEESVPQVISFAAYWWMISNSLVNTVIYYIKNTKYRDRVHELAAKLVPSCFRDLEGRLPCTCWCSRSRNTLPYSCGSSGGSGRPNVELIVVKTEELQDTVSPFRKI